MSGAPWPEESAFLYILNMGEPWPYWTGKTICDINFELTVRNEWLKQWRRKQEAAGVRMPLMTELEDRLDRLLSCLYYFQLKMTGCEDMAKEWKTWALEPRDWTMPACILLADIYQRVSQL